VLRSPSTGEAFIVSLKDLLMEVRILCISHRITTVSPHNLALHFLSFLLSFFISFSELCLAHNHIQFVTA
jgi:hypothetical protein